jgi:peptidoglycan-associated lipoprotein
LIKKRLSVILAGILAGSVIGCATSKDVDSKIAASQARNDQKIESVETQVETIQDKQKQQDARIAELGQSAADALKRAEEAGVLAKGKVVFQQTFTEDRVRFKVDSADLNGEATRALDEFADKAKAVNEPIYMEIQGHTDDTGSRKYNDALGDERADSVRRYLSRQHQLPLARMSTISYGDTLPLASNKTAKGRAQNRRVVIVVLE